MQVRDPQFRQPMFHRQMITVQACKKFENHLPPIDLRLNIAFPSGNRIRDSSCEPKSTFSVAR